MLEGLFKSLIGEKVTRVGKVDPSLGQALQENEAAHDAAHKGIVEKAKAYMDQLRADHQPICDKFHAEKEAIWEQIYDQLDLPEHERDATYKIDSVTGVVRKIEVDFDTETDDDEENAPLQ